MTDFRAARPWCSRRDFLKNSAAVAAGVYGMGWGLADAADPPLEFDGSKFLLKAAEPNPKHGGVIRMGIPVRPPHFDLHQSGTIFNLGAMGCMFDNLIRRDPRDGGKTIIPDLAHSCDRGGSIGDTLRATLRARPQERDRPRRCGGTCLHRRLAVSCPGDRKQPRARLLA
jgi:hypothetical protein